MLATALDVFVAICDTLELALDYRRWRDDWDRTWSPVSFWFAVGAFVLLAVVACLWGRAGWQALSAAFS